MYFMNEPSTKILVILVLCTWLKIVHKQIVSLKDFGNLKHVYQLV